MKKFGQNLQLASDQGRKSTNPDRVLISQEATHEIFQFMVNLVVAIRAKRTQSLLQPLNVQLLEPLLNEETAQFQWILSKLESDTFTPVVDLANSYLQLANTIQKGENLPPENFQVFADYFDQTYPQLLGSPMSWVTIFEHNGVSAIHRRFNGFWERPRTDSLTHGPKWQDHEKNKESFAAYYLKTRLLPVFSSHLLARLIDAQTISEQQARHSFLRLKERSNSNNHDPEFNRLCGTWHWTVHNHQNHRDHKMQLSFLPPPQPPGSQPQPDEIIIHGDTVYLKWEFQSGFQEDSLLLSNRDQRLEGTFRNSLGARGTITGKRLKTCPLD